MATPAQSVNQPRLYQLPGIDIPSLQEAIVTAEVGPSLALKRQSIPVRDPETGEAVVEIICTGICRSVS
jgi:propanol-preferring alcohol dehydrogenase